MWLYIQNQISFFQRISWLNQRKETSKKRRMNENRLQNLSKLDDKPLMTPIIPLSFHSSETNTIFPRHHSAFAAVLSRQRPENKNGQECDKNSHNSRITGWGFGFHSKMNYLLKNTLVSRISVQTWISVQPGILTTIK